MFTFQRVLSSNKWKLIHTVVEKKKQADNPGGSSSQCKPLQMYASVSLYKKKVKIKQKKIFT